MVLEQGFLDRDLGILGEEGEVGFFSISGKCYDTVHNKWLSSH